MSTRTPPVPATPDESAILLALLRAIVATTLTYRKDFRLRLTERQRERAAGVLVRVVMDADGTIEAWLQPPDPEMRHGVPYLGRDPEPSAEEPA